MELENLKEAWIALDNSLKRNEKLSEKIILAEMRSKAGKKVNRFIALEMFSFVVLLLMIPFCIWLFNLVRGKFWALEVYFIYAGVICLIYAFWDAYKLHGLIKFDVIKNVSDNILCMNRYNIQIVQEIKILKYFVGPIFVILAVVVYADLKATLFHWSILICTLIIVTFVNHWIFKKYDKSIGSVVRSMEEINELKEE